MDSNKLIHTAQHKLETLTIKLSENPATNIHNKFEMLNETLKEIVDENIPIRKLTKKEFNLKHKPWLNKDLIKASKYKNKLYKKLIKINFKDTELHKKYKNYRNKLAHRIDAAKKQHYQKQLHKFKNDTKQTWNTINKIIGKNKNPTELPSKLRIKNKIYSEPQQICNLLNEHFSEMGKHDNNNEINFNCVNSYLDHSQSDSIFFYETTPEELSIIIQNLKNKNSQGPDEVPISVVKKLNLLICPILANLINESLKLGEYPNCLKMGKVLPIFKSGNHMEPGNHRPITLLPAINKIFEKLIYNRLISFFETYKIINTNQHGFRSGHSTELATCKFYEDVLINLNNNHASCAVIIDLSKAFDSVNHQILLHKLYRYGIRGSTHQLLTSYLKNRTQYIQVNNIKSNICHINTGVPQGSIIAPLLFLIMINDLKNSTNMNVLNFADDTLLYTKISKTNNIELEINTELNKVHKWLKTNHLKLNFSKTNFIRFYPKLTKSNTPPEITLSFESINKIDEVNEFKYLGLNIDKNLLWKIHIEKLTKKISKGIGILYRIRPYLNKPSLKLLLHSLIISHIKYAIICYGRTNKTTLAPLNVLLNRALRCINYLGRRDKKTSLIYFDKNILKIEDIFKLELGKFCFKFCKNVLPTAFNNYFTNLQSIHSHNTRNSANRFFLNT